MNNKEKTLRVLIIDDCKLDCAFLVESLKKMNLFNTSIDICDLPTKDRMSKEHFDIVFLDYAFQGITATDFLIVNKHLIDEFPIVIISDCQSPVIGCNLLRFGVQDFINKESIMSTNFDIFISNILERFKRDQHLKLLLHNTQTFTSIVSHDLRNPLSTIKSYLDILLEEDAATQEEIIGILKNSVDSSLIMLDSLLSDLQLKSKEIILDLHPVEVKDYLENIASEVKRLIENKDLDFNLNLKELEAKSVVIDEIKIKNVILNLINNSCKFTNAGGKIELGAYVTGDNNILRFYVKDTGLGIDEETIQALFDENANVSKDGVDGERGFGIGLHYCQKVLKKHKSQMNVESKKDLGSTFYFDLPTS